MNNKAPNIACRRSLVDDIHKRILNYVRYFQVRIENLLLNRRCTVSIDVHSNGKLSFYSNPVKMFEDRPYHGFRRHFDEKANRLEITVFVWKSDVK